MSRKTSGIAAAAIAAALVMVAAEHAARRPLWPGARFTTADRDHAVRRGLFFLYAIARRPDVFDDWGHDLLSAFVNLASTSGSRSISDLAWRMGHERAFEWRRLHRTIPANADATDVANLVYGSDAAELLGVPDAHLREALTDAAKRFAPTDFLDFDPSREPPPFQHRYALFQDALIATYTGDHFGVSLGAHYFDVLRWLPLMHPYPPRSAGAVPYYDAIYTATHVVYTYNGYDASRVSPGCFPEEFTYLKSNLPQAIADRDPETLGEFLDSLQAFGMTIADPVIRRGVEDLLATQNSDGSWGDPRETDAYARYHTTWTAINGIQTFRWTRVLPCPPGPGGTGHSQN